ncbi:MAG: glycosyltransferase family 39 protein [Alphaproteobacteria bacterium]|nr:glycosyltransferase family 39 protein [Alphaproteobacteria bacterium]
MKTNATVFGEPLGNLRAQVVGPSADRAHVIAIGAICIIGFVLRFLLLTHHSFDGDELFSYYWAHFSFSELWTGALGDIHPPLYYSVQKIILILGDSETLFRAPVAVLGTVSVLLVYFLARRIVDETAALLAAALMATSPIQIYYSQWARPYALLTAAALGAALTAVGIFKNYAQGALSRWAERALYVLLMTIALYTHSMACLLFAVTAIYGLASIAAGRSLKCLLEWSALNGAVLLLWSWWLIVVVHQAEAGLGQMAWLAPPTLRFVALELASAYGTMFIWHFGPAISILTLVAVGIVLTNTVMMILSRTVSSRIPLAYLFAVVVFVPAVEIGISLAWRPIFMQRTILWTVPFFFILAAIAIKSLCSTRAIPVLLSGVAAIFILDFWAHYRKPVHEDFRTLVDEVYAASRDGDVIVTGEPWVYSGVNYYLAKHSPRALIVVDRSTNEMRRDGHLPPISVQHLPPATDRIWFIDGPGDADPELSAELAPYRLVRRYDEHGTSAVLYQDTRVSP